MMACGVGVDTRAQTRPPDTKAIRTPGVIAHVSRCNCSSITIFAGYVLLVPSGVGEVRPVPLFLGRSLTLAWGLRVRKILLELLQVKRRSYAASQICQISFCMLFHPRVRDHLKFVFVLGASRGCGLGRHGEM